MESFPELGDSLEEVLERMAGQGTVFTSQRPEAVELALRAEAKPPPDLSEFLTVRYKQG